MQSAESAASCSVQITCAPTSIVPAAVREQTWNHRKRQPQAPATPSALFRCTLHQLTRALTPLLQLCVCTASIAHSGCIAHSGWHSEQYRGNFFCAFNQAQDVRVAPPAPGAVTQSSTRTWAAGARRVRPVGLSKDRPVQITTCKACCSPGSLSAQLRRLWRSQPRRRPQPPPACGTLCWSVARAHTCYVCGWVCVCVLRVCICMMSCYVT